MITLDEWAEIRACTGLRACKSRRSREVGVSKNTVRRGLGQRRSLAYQRAPRGSIAHGAERAIREQLALCATMPATVIAERIGWDRSITVLREKVAGLRPFYLPADPVSRTSYEPGERVQDDFWFPQAEIPLGHGTVAAGRDGLRCW